MVVVPESIDAQVPYPAELSNREVHLDTSPPPLNAEG
jgi:hypothetical protein